jgi:peroxiredoxin
MIFRMVSASVLTVGTLLAAGAVDQAVARFEATVAKAPASVSANFLQRASADLKDRYPEQARRLLEKAKANAATAPAMPRSEPAPAALPKKIATMRSLATDADRAKLVLEVVPEIRALPAGVPKLLLSSSLANVSTEGDLGKTALSAVARALAESARELNGANSAPGAWIEVASLVRYEFVDPPFADPSLDAAIALLDLRESLQGEATFTLTSLDGKTYSRDGLRGRVVLLNFWATWCPPCRREMPDMEKLYRKFESKGLTVLGVSDEKRETVEGFLAKTLYSFPILLDPGREVHTAFGVQGIPKSFLFDREGRLAAIAIDMRTERQFLELLKKAGLE